MQSLSSFRKPDTTKTLGLEWEVFVHEVNYVAAYKHMGFFYVTRDGSMYDAPGAYDGREFVSQPMPATWLCKEVERLAKKIPSRYANATCGIHVHASRKWATKERVKAISKVLDTLTKDEYAELFGRKPNQYCYHPCDTEYTQKTADRYWYINITNSATVEFRMFASGTQVKWVQYCIRMVEYLLTNAYHLNKEALFAFSDMTKAV